MEQFQENREMLKLREAAAKFVVFKVSKSVFLRIIFPTKAFLVKIQ